MLISTPRLNLMEEANENEQEARRDATLPQATSKPSRDFMAAPRSPLLSIARSPLVSIPNPSQNPKSSQTITKLPRDVMASPRSPLITIPRSPLVSIPNPSETSKSTVAGVSSRVFSDLPPLSDPRGTTRKRTLRRLLENEDLSFRKERNVQAKVNEDSPGDVMALQRQIQVLKDQLECMEMSRDTNTVTNHSCNFKPGNLGANFSEYNANSSENYFESDAAILSNQKVVELEAALAGSLRRERIAEAEVKKLKVEMKHMEHLVHDLREDLKETRRLEKELKGKLDCVRGAALAMSELQQRELLECLPQTQALKCMRTSPCELFLDESVFDKVAELHQGELMDMRKSMCNLSVIGSSQSLPACVDLVSDERPSEVH